MTSCRSTLSSFSRRTSFRENEVKILEGDKVTVGGYTGKKYGIYKKTLIKLKKGDQIYMFSDGYVDQFGGPQGKKFKYKNFRELFRRIQKLPMDKQKEAVFQTFMSWKGDNEQVDDVCVIGVRV